jgi:hypothetical protein
MNHRAESKLGWLAPRKWGCTPRLPQLRNLSERPFQMRIHFAVTHG